MSAASDSSRRWPQSIGRRLQLLWSRNSLTIPVLPLILVIALMNSGCGVVNLGKWKGIERTARDESYYLVKNIYLTAGSMAQPRYTYDHMMQDSINLVFIPSSEKNYYTSKTTWLDPSGQEYRTIRQTHDKRAEEADGSERPKGGSTRIHSVATRDLWKHKPGLWKVELYLDDVLVRRFNFEVR